MFPGSIKLLTSLLFILLLTSSCNQNSSNSSTTSVRIIALAPHLAELTIAAGASDNLVGVVSYSQVPDDVKNVKYVGDAFKLDYEGIIALQADYILSWKSGTPQASVERLKALGLNVVETSISELKDIPKIIKQISKLTKTEAKAQTNIDNFNQKLKSFKNKKFTKKSAFIQISKKPIYTVSGKHWMSEAIEICGYQNIFQDLEAIAAAVSLESIIAKNPEVIINIDQSEDDKWFLWPKLRAVKQNSIHTISPDLFSQPSPTLLKGIEQLCATQSL